MHRHRRPIRHARACRGHPRLSQIHREPKTWMAGSSPAMTRRQFFVTASEPIIPTTPLTHSTPHPEALDAKRRASKDEAKALRSASFEARQARTSG